MPVTLRSQRVKLLLVNNLGILFLKILCRAVEFSVIHTGTPRCSRLWSSNTDCQLCYLSQYLQQRYSSLILLVSLCYYSKLHCLKIHTEYEKKPQFEAETVLIKVVNHFSNSSS